MNDTFGTNEVNHIEGGPRGFENTISMTVSRKNCFEGGGENTGIRLTCGTFFVFCWCTQSAGAGFKKILVGGKTVDENVV